VNSPKSPNTIRISGAVYIMIDLDFVASFATSAITCYVAYVVPVLGRANAVDPSPSRSGHGLCSPPGVARCIGGGG
jgi:hypothetical protein